MNSRKVIVVEDDKLLATVFSMFLKELGHDLTGFFTDGTRAIEKCEEELPDVILMDIHIPGEIDGIRAAEIIQEKYDIPVIFITGDTDSETVKRALRTRSYGYLVKPIDKTELGINIQLACIKNKYDRDIRIREKRYRSLLDVSQDTIMLIVNGIIEYVNYAGLRMFETIHIEDLLEKPFFSFVPEEYQEGLSRCFRELFDGKTGKIEYSPFKIRSLNNKLYTVGIVGSAVDFKNEKAIQMVITNQTEYLETRRLVTEQHNVIENIHDGIITMSLNGTVSSWNAGAERIFGRKKEDVEGKSITTLFPDKDEMELQKIFLEQPLEEQNTETVIDFFDTRNGQTRHLQFTLSVLTNSGNETTGIVCYCTDITERKQKTETLRNSRANLKAIFDSSTEAIFFIDDEYRIIDYNRLAKQYVRKFFKKEVETGVSVLHLLSFLDNSEYEQLFENALDGIAHYLERAVLTGDKKQFFKITIYPITTEDDSSTNRFCISFLDITERKRTEKELVETHAELKPLFDSSIQRFYLADPDYKLVAFNKSAREIIKKENKHNLQKGDNLLDFVPPEIGEEEFIRKFNTAIGGKNVVFKAKLSYENESYWIEGHLDPIKDETGETKRILFWTIDISEREENLAALKKSEERYALIASGSNDGLWDWDMVNDELYVSPRWKAVIGYDADVEISSNEMKENLIHPDDIGAMHLTLQKYLDGEIKTYVNEFRIKHRSGEYHWIMERGTVLRDETGKPYRFAGSITDITDAKKAEEEIISANRALLEERRMFIRGNVVIFRVDAGKFTNIKYVSDNVGEVLGYTAQEFYSGSVDFTALIHPDDYEVHENERKEAIGAGKDHFDFSNYRLIRKDNEVIWVKDSTSILRDENGTVIELLGYIVDITKEKRAEEGLFENQKKYYSLFSQASDAIIIIENDVILDCNSKAIQLFGYPHKEFVGLNLLKLSPEMQTKGEASDEKRLRKLKEIEEDKSRTFHWIYSRKDGSHFDAEVSIALVQMGDKKVLHAIVRDITDRIRIENSLRETEQKTKALLEAIPDIIFIVDKEGKYLDYRPDNKSGLEVPSEEVIGKHISDFFRDNKLQEALEKNLAAIQGKKTQTLEYKLDSPIGERWFETRITAFREEKALWLARDVTERIEMENRLKEINTALEEKVERLSKGEDGDS